MIGEWPHSESGAYLQPVHAPRQGSAAPAGTAPGLAPAVEKSRIDRLLSVGVAVAPLLGISGGSTRSAAAAGVVVDSSAVAMWSVGGSVAASQWHGLDDADATDGADSRRWAGASVREQQQQRQLLQQQRRREFQREAARMRARLQRRAAAAAASDEQLLRDVAARALGEQQPRGEGAQDEDEEGGHGAPVSVAAALEQEEAEWRELGAWLREHRLGSALSALRTELGVTSLEALQCCEAGRLAEAVVAAEVGSGTGVHGGGWPAARTKRLLAAHAALREGRAPSPPPTPGHRRAAVAAAAAAATTTTTGAAAAGASEEGGGGGRGRGGRAASSFSVAGVLARSQLQEGEALRLRSLTQLGLARERAEWVRRGEQRVRGVA
jgi:hypothetical protein